MSQYSFRVPASTSNLGAGFDTLGLALDLCLKITIEDAPECSIEAHGVNAESIPKGPECLILRVAQCVAAERSRKLPAFHMSIENGIPLARGLGSSAAAIVAGITCYELMAQDCLSDNEILHFASEFEPHPDNLAATLYGGLIAAATASTGEVLVSRLKVAPGVTPVIVIPEFELSTEKARATLPRTYSRADVIYNIQRSALTVAALTTGKWPLLREAMRDRIHQPFRAQLIPGLDEILALETDGLLGVALSGAGPTVLAFAEPEVANAVGKAIAAVFERHSVHAVPHKTAIDLKGRIIEA